jgi:uncharacterized protein (TIGR00255 family)
MIKSMTGFGEAERVIEGIICRVEIKTVNHRFFNLNFRIPNAFSRFETKIQKVLQEVITRGHVNYGLSIRSGDATGLSNFPELDLERAKFYWETLKVLQKELGIEDEIGLSHIIGESFKDTTESIPIENIGKDEIIDLTRVALEEVVAFRTDEGSNIEKDLRARLVVLEDLLQGIETRAPERLVSERDRLQRSVMELIGADLVDQDRLSREIAILADKWDISEEIVRLRSHLDLFSGTLKTDPAGVVGKKLGFILQEIHREANTINSKANDGIIGNAGITLKEEIERIREQLENVE